MMKSVENPHRERMGPTIKLRSYIIEQWNMSQGWVNSPMMFWRDNKAGSENTHFALDSWDPLLIGQGKYFAFSTDRPSACCALKKHTRCDCPPSVVSERQSLQEAKRV